MQAIEAAASEPDRPFVLVIEEINRKRLSKPIYEPRRSDAELEG
jgi:hypothetical protein